MSLNSDSPIFSRKSKSKSSNSSEESCSSDSDLGSKRGKNLSSKAICNAKAMSRKSRGLGDSPARDAVLDKDESNREQRDNLKSKTSKKECLLKSDPPTRQKSKKKRKVSESENSASVSESTSISSSDNGRKVRKSKKKKTRKSKGSRRHASSSSSYSDVSSDSSSSEDDDLTDVKKKFTFSKTRSKEIRNFLTKACKTEELRQLRKYYDPKFDSKSFDLKRPKLDRQMKRRLKRVRSYDAARATAREKNLANIQFKILDVFRPMLYAWALICSDEASDEHPLQAAVVCAMKLLGHVFNYLSGQRRSNILKVTDPEYEDVANDPDLYDPRETSHLFGKSFIHNLAQEIEADSKMDKAMGRPGSSHSAAFRGKRRDSRQQSGRGGVSFGSTSSSFKRDSSSYNRNYRRSVSLSQSPIIAITNRPDIPFGGRISRFLNFWRSITTDSWVLTAVEHGVAIPFRNTPLSGFCERNIVHGDAIRICDAEVLSLLNKGAIEMVPEAEARFTSAVFIIPKSSGGHRMIINLKPINKFIEHMHFKMESLALLRDMVRKGDHFVKIDLTDAYLSVPLFKPHRRFVQFRWNGRCYQFRTLCFGLSIAPWAFTKILKPVVAYLRSLGIRLIVYLDDILIINSTKEGAEADFLRVRLVLERCGFLVNLDKSVASACQIIEFLGTRPNSLTMSLTLKEEKLLQIQQLCDNALKAKEINLRALAKILGNLAWAVQAVPYAQAHYRGLQTLFNHFYHFQRNSFELTIRLNPSSMADLHWWKEHVVKCSGKSLEELKPDLTIYSDASLKGWGAAMNEAYASGPWETEHESKHINELELMAAFNALKSFAKHASNVTIHLMLDNATAVAYINKCGGTHSIALRDLALEIIQWCEERCVVLKAFHLPGKENIVADYHSRFHADSSDWKLDIGVFAKLQAIWPSSVDLFAASWNKQLDCFVSWRNQPDCLALDALSLNWRRMRGYLFPPFCLVSRCLAKIRRDKALVTLVTPLWPTQPWFPLAVELVCDVPRLLPQNSRLLTGPRGEEHPLLQQQTFRLIAWRLSGDVTMRENFQQTCQSYCCLASEMELSELINPLGEHGFIGVANGRGIPLLPL